MEINGNDVQWPDRFKFFNMIINNKPNVDEEFEKNRKTLVRIYFVECKNNKKKVELCVTITKSFKATYN